MQKRQISWITADYFIDVDLPIISELLKSYSINWIIVISKSCKIDYRDLINSYLFGADISIEYVYLKYRLRNPKIILDYIAVLKKVNKNQLTYFDFTGFPYLFLVCYFLINKSKSIIAMHNATTPKSASNYYAAKYYTILTRKLYKNFQVFSKTQYNYLKRVTHNKNIFYAPLALKNFGVPTVPKDKDITFLFFGYIRGYKSLDVLITAAQKAYSIVQRKFKVIIAGNCENWDSYDRLIDNKSLFELHIGFIKNEDIPNLFARSHYFVMPYKDIAQSGAMLTALQYRLPVIASDLPAFHEYIEDSKTGYFIKPASIESLTDVMVEILTNGTVLYDYLVQNINILINSNLSTKSIAKKYISFFENI